MNFVVIASGKSLTYADVAHCCGRAQTVVVNDCWQWAPWADALYAADYDWWASTPRFIADDRGALRPAHEYAAPNHIMTARMGRRRYTMDVHAADHFDLTYLKSEDKPGLGTNGAIHLGGNSGYQAINLAYKLGAKRILLLGFDMGATGLGHWFGAHPTIKKVSPAGHEFVEDMERTREECFADWRQAMRVLAHDLAKADVETINCTRVTALNCFPCAPIDKVLG